MQNISVLHGFLGLGSFFDDIVDFEEDFAEKARKMIKLYFFFSILQFRLSKFLALGIEDTVVICKVTLNNNRFV